MKFQGILIVAVFVLVICSLPCGALPGPIEEGISAAGFEVRDDSIASIVLPSGSHDSHMSKSDVDDHQITGEEHHTGISQVLPFGPEEPAPLSRLTAAEIEQVQSSKAGLAETGMKAQGDAVVLVPVTPSPAGCGYAYQYLGTDTDYWIYGPGTYTMGSDISAMNPFVITITAPDVYLDGNGHAITGTGTGTGIMLINSSISIANVSRISGFNRGLNSTGVDATIRNSSFTHNEFGVQMNGNSTLITGIITNGNTIGGILAFGSHSSIHDSAISGNQNTGIVTYDCTNISIRNNVIENNTYGSLLILGSKSDIRNNTIRNNGGGIDTTDEGVVIADNIISSNKYDGILSYGDDAIISGNTISDSEERGIYSLGLRTVIRNNSLDTNPAGLNATGNNSIITENVVMNSSDTGIINRGENSTVSRNQVSGNYEGIGSVGDNSTIIGNTVRATEHVAIYSFNSNSKIADNTVDDGSIILGIMGGNNTVMGNIIRNATRTGISIWGWDTIIAHNTVQNSTTGIDLSYGAASVADNVLVNNSKFGIFSDGFDHEIYRNMISGSQIGINMTGTGATLADNRISGNEYYGIQSSGNDTVIRGNSVVNNTRLGVMTFGDSITFTGNDVSNNWIGMFSFGNNSVISKNTVDFNQLLGLGYGGVNTTVSQNEVVGNKIGGIEVDGSHTVVSQNNISRNGHSGIFMSADYASLIDNRFESNRYAFSPYVALDTLLFTGNTLLNNTDAGIYLDNTSNGGNGSIYNNYFGNLKNVDGEGDAGQFNWTNPVGPQSGTSVVGGPYVAGNYWSNPNGTGWSDLQPANQNGYITTPYPVSAGANDTAPLVRPGVSPVTLTANFTAVNVTGIPPLTVRFADLSTGNPTQWRWNLGDGSYSTLQNPVHTYQGIGRYTITLEVENQDATAIVRKTEFIKTVRK